MPVVVSLGHASHGINQTSKNCQIISVKLRNLGRLIRLLHLWHKILRIRDTIMTQYYFLEMV